MKNLTELLKALGPGSFKPLPCHNVDAKQITWFWKNVSYYADPITHDNKWIGDVYKSIDSNEIVGVSIHLEAIRGEMGIFGGS